jgi:hypothetical protein
MFWLSVSKDILDLQSAMDFMSELLSMIISPDTMQVGRIPNVSGWIPRTVDISVIPGISYPVTINEPVFGSITGNNAIDHLFRSDAILSPEGMVQLGIQLPAFAGDQAGQGILDDYRAELRAAYTPGISRTVLLGKIRKISLGYRLIIINEIKNRIKKKEMCRDTAQKKINGIKKVLTQEVLDELNTKNKEALVSEINQAFQKNLLYTVTECRIEYTPANTPTNSPGLFEDIKEKRPLLIKDLVIKNKTPENKIFFSLNRDSMAGILTEILKSAAEPCENGDNTGLWYRYPLRATAKISLSLNTDGFNKALDLLRVDGYSIIWKNSENKILSCDNLPDFTVVGAPGQVKIFDTAPQIIKDKVTLPTLSEITLEVCEGKP